MMNYSNIKSAWLLASRDLPPNLTIKVNKALEAMPEKGVIVSFPDEIDALGRFLTELESASKSFTGSTDPKMRNALSTLGQMVEAVRRRLTEVSAIRDMVNRLFRDVANAGKAYSDAPSAANLEKLQALLDQYNNVILKQMWNPTPMIGVLSKGPSTSQKSRPALQVIKNCAQLPTRILANAQRMSQNHKAWLTYEMEKAKLLEMVKELAGKGVV